MTNHHEQIWHLANVILTNASCKSYKCTLGCLFHHNTITLWTMIIISMILIVSWIVGCKPYVSCRKHASSGLQRWNKSRAGQLGIIGGVPLDRSVRAWSGSTLSNEPSWLDLSTLLLLVWKVMLTVGLQDLDLYRSCLKQYFKTLPCPDGHKIFRPIIVLRKSPQTQSAGILKKLLLMTPLLTRNDHGPS